MLCKSLIAFCKEIRHNIMSNKYNYVNKKHINWINLSFAKELAIKNTSNCCKIAKQRCTQYLNN